MISTLTDLEKLGIKILALHNTNLLPEWVDDPNDDGSDFLDLRVLVSEDLYEDFDYQINANPFDYIPHSIFKFFDEYAYYEKYESAAPKYNEVSGRFWEATKLYDNLINKLELYKLKKQNKSNNNSNNMEAISKMINRR